MNEEFRSIFEFALKVASTAVVVLGILWRALDKMITRKVKEQLDEAMIQLTETTSKAVDGLRQELHDVNSDSQRKADQRTDRITKRIDEIMLHLTTKGR